MSIIERSAATAHAVIEQQQQPLPPFSDCPSKLSGIED